MISPTGPEKPSLIAGIPTTSGDFNPHQIADSRLQAESAAGNLQSQLQAFTEGLRSKFLLTASLIASPIADGKDSLGENEIDGHVDVTRKPIRSNVFSRRVVGEQIHANWQTYWENETYHYRHYYRHSLSFDSSESELSLKEYTLYVVDDDGDEIQSFRVDFDEYNCPNILTLRILQPYASTTDLNPLLHIFTPEAFSRSGDLDGYSHHEIKILLGQEPSISFNQESKKYGKRNTLQSLLTYSLSDMGFIRTYPNEAMRKRYADLASKSFLPNGSSSFKPNMSVDEFMTIVKAVAKMIPSKDH